MWLLTKSVEQSDKTTVMKAFGLHVEVDVILKMFSSVYFFRSMRCVIKLLTFLNFPIVCLFNLTISLLAYF